MGALVFNIVGALEFSTVGATLLLRTEGAALALMNDGEGEIVPFIEGANDGVEDVVAFVEASNVGVMELVSLTTDGANVGWIESVMFSIVGTLVTVGVPVELVKLEGVGVKPPGKTGVLKVVGAGLLPSDTIRLEQYTPLKTSPDCRYSPM